METCSVPGLDLKIRDGGVTLTVLHWSKNGLFQEVFREKNRRP